MKGVFDPGVIESTKEMWGLDEEDEMCGAYRPTGHPAVISSPQIQQPFDSHVELTALVRLW